MSVIPAEAGIESFQEAARRAAFNALDSRLRGNDEGGLDSRLRGNDEGGLDSRLRGNDEGAWIPACAGMTGEGETM